MTGAEGKPAPPVWFYLFLFVTFVFMAERSVLPSDISDLFEDFISPQQFLAMACADEDIAVIQDGQETSVHAEEGTFFFVTTG